MFDEKLFCSPEGLFICNRQTINGTQVLNQTCLGWNFLTGIHTKLITGSQYNVFYWKICTKESLDSRGFFQKLPRPLVRCWTTICKSKILLKNWSTILVLMVYALGKIHSAWWTRNGRAHVQMVKASSWKNLQRLKAFI